MVIHYFMNIVCNGENRKNTGSIVHPEKQENTLFLCFPIIMRKQASTDRWRLFYRLQNGCTSCSGGSQIGAPDEHPPVFAVLGVHGISRARTDATAILCIACDTLPNRGKMMMYTLGWPNTQNRCWYKIGSPPAATS